MRVRFNAGCLSDTQDGQGGRTLGLATVAATCSAATNIVTHNSKVLQFLLPEGIGANLTVAIEIVEQMPTRTAAPILYTSTAMPVSGFVYDIHARRRRLVFVCGG